HTATTSIYSLSLHDALPIYGRVAGLVLHIDAMGELHGIQIIRVVDGGLEARFGRVINPRLAAATGLALVDGELAWQLCGLRLFRSEEHTSELQSRENLVCRL